VFGDQHASARVDVKGARVYRASLDVLDRGRFAGGLIDRVHHDAVFAAFEYPLALKLDRRLGAIRSVQKTTVRMNVNGACRLTRSSAGSGSTAITALMPLTNLSASDTLFTSMPMKSTVRTRLLWSRA
jgi:hypothetical protein